MSYRATERATERAGELDLSPPLRLRFGFGRPRPPAPLQEQCFMILPFEAVAAGMGPARAR